MVLRRAQKDPKWFEERKEEFGDNSEMEYNPIIGWF